MIQIYIALAVGAVGVFLIFLAGFLTCLILTSGRVGDGGETILRQQARIEELEGVVGKLKFDMEA